MDAASMELLSHGLKAVAICNILSGIPSSVKMWRTGDTQDWPTLFFIVGLVGAAGMVHYGLIVENSTLVMINFLQAIVNCYYILTYLVLTEHKGSPVMSLLMAGAYVGGLYSYARWNHYDSLPMSNLLGLSSGMVFFVMNSVPISDVISTYSSKRANYDLTMLGAGMVNSFLWTVYGLLLNDIYIYMPGLPFLFSGALKISQMVMYQSATSKPAKKTQ